MCLAWCWVVGIPGKHTPAPTRRETDGTLDDFPAVQWEGRYNVQGYGPDHGTLPHEIPIDIVVALTSLFHLGMRHDQT